MAEAAQKTLGQHLRNKFIGYVFAAVVVHILVTTLGFPSAFVVACHGFTFVGFIFFILLDLPPMKDQTGVKGVMNLFLTFLIFSAVYTITGYLHPQYNPEVEIAKINKPPLKVEAAAGPELIAAGKSVYADNKCFNCHKAVGEGSSDRGPGFDDWQIGLYDKKYLEEAIVDPRKEQSKGFEDEKSKKEMPTYYGDDIDKNGMKALLAFMGSLWSDQKMPVIGKAGALVRWDEDPAMIAEGKKVFEGEFNEEVNCSVCHGMDGIPLMEGAADLRKPDHVSKISNKPLKEWTDADWFASVSKGVEDTPMAAWGEMLPPRAIWLAVAYAKTFSKQ